jgi:cytochrome c553
MGRIIGIGLAALLVPAIAAGDDAEFFEAKVRPVLAAHCVSCHGPEKQKAGLRLDTPEGMKKGGESGPVVSPGKPEASRLVEAISYHDDSLQMPPKRKMGDPEIETLTRWVKSGALWPEPKATRSASDAKGGAVSAKDREFWSFRPVKKVEPPPVKDAAWSRSPIDRFLFATMDARGLSPAPRADKRTLIRRVTFDLTGLPPTPEEVEAFVKDDSPETFAKVVDRLLASPHYGERWARHWLDLARYGEDQAHTFQARVFPQGYRYRDWVVNALNADMPYDRFLTEQIAADLIDGPSEGKRDRLAALGFFGLGASYYSGSPTAVADERDDKLDTLCRSMLGLTVACARCHDHKFDPIPTTDYYALAGIVASTVYKEYPDAPAEEVAAFDKAQAAINAKTQEISEFLAAEGRKVPERAAREDTARYVVAAWTLMNRRKAEPDLKTAAFAKAEGVRPEWLDRWAGYLFDRKAAKGRPHLARWRKALEADDPKRDVSKDRAAADSVRAIGEGLQAHLKATLTLREALYTFTNADLGDPADRPKLRESDRKAIEEIASEGGVFSTGRGKQTEAFLGDPAKAVLKDKRGELDRLKKLAPAKYAVIHAVAEGTSPANLRVHLRGNPANLGDEVPRRFLSVVSPEDAKPFRQGSGRLELAKAVASKDNPLTARVIVNRIWAQHFARGIVATPSNFGAMGERPSHPELLDWLAARLVEGGWSLKSLHREILLSAAYAQSSVASPRAHEVDGDNVYLSHANRRRLEIEPWRDAMLAVTGELDPRLGGPSADLSSTDNRRRTLYAQISRHKLDGLLRQFDFPDPNLTSDRRTVSTVPLQGLFVLNSDFMAKRADALANRLAKEAKEDEARIRRAFVLLYGRPAGDEEVAMGVEFLKAAGPSGWSQYAQALIGANEFLFVD